MAQSLGNEMHGEQDFAAREHRYSEPRAPLPLVLGALGYVLAASVQGGLGGGYGFLIGVVAGGAAAYGASSRAKDRGSRDHETGDRDHE